jgi:hypothetical protein
MDNHKDDKMKKVILTAAATLAITCIFGQMVENKKIIELGKAYKDFMFRVEPGKDDLKTLNSEVPQNLQIATQFILQTISTKNKILDKAYLSRPEDQVLKQIFIIEEINQNAGREDQVDNNKLMDSLSAKNIPTYELIDNYYGMLFTAVGNKDQPFNLSKIDLRLNDYNLKDDTEKGILVLKAISLCASNIWGYMNIVKPPNTEKALSYINKFPKINGRPYYQYTDFYFSDFNMNIVEGEGLQSYKTYYLDKFYEALLSHLICLNKENGSEKEKNDLLLGSILKETNLYKYTTYKETLEGIFKEQKK